MALEKVVFDELMSAKETFRREVKLLCLGYPDLLVTKDDLKKAGVKEFVKAPDSEKIARWHNWPGDLYESTSVFKQLGFAPTYVDIHASRGIETILDLNTVVSLPEYDILLDPGTLEHCFNVGNAFRAICERARIGSFVVHNNPASQVNHGFWNFCPTAYVDFYEQNGFELKRLKGMTGPTTLRKVSNLPPTDRVQVPPETTAFCVVRKVSTVPFRWPLQSKYLNNKDLKG